MHPVADLEPARPDALVQARPADDRAVEKRADDEVAALGGVPLRDLGPPYIDRQGLVGNPRHERPQVVEVGGDRSGERLGVGFPP